jgi:hypothetical protein
MSIGFPHNDVVMFRNQAAAVSASFLRKIRFVLGEAQVCGDNLSVGFYIQNSISLTIAVRPRIFPCKMSTERGRKRPPGLNRIH